MTELSQISKNKSILPEELSEQLKTLGISSEELVQQLVDLDLSLDEVLKKMASVGIPSVLLVMIIYNFGTFPLVTPLATSLAGTIGVIGDSLAGYSIEITVVSFYLARLKTDSLEDLCEEISLLPFTDTLKNKVKERLRNEPISRVERKFTIVQD